MGSDLLFIRTTHEALLLALRRDILMVHASGVTWEKLALKCCVGKAELIAFTLPDVSEAQWAGKEFNKFAFHRVSDGIKKMIRKDLAPEIALLRSQIQDAIDRGYVSRRNLAKMAGISTFRLKTFLDMTDDAAVEESLILSLTKFLSLRKH